MLSNHRCPSRGEAIGLLQAGTTCRRQRGSPHAPRPRRSCAVVSRSPSQGGSMRSLSLALSFAFAASFLASPASAQDSSLVRYAAELRQADRLLPLNRRDYFEPGARLTTWTRALAAITPPAALASAHRRLVGYSREYARQQTQATPVPSTGIDACIAGQITPDQTCPSDPSPPDAHARFDQASATQRRYVVVRREIARQLQAAGLVPPASWLAPALN